jgi:hypothetical protein
VQLRIFHVPEYISPLHVELIEEGLAKVAAAENEDSPGFFKYIRKD